MKIERRTAEVADILAIFDAPWAVTADELTRFGPIPEEIKSALCAAIRPLNLEVWDLDGKLGWLTGHSLQPLDQKVYMLFLGGAIGDNMGAAVVRAGRHVVAYVRSLYPGMPLVCKTYSAHPECARWYRLLGFRAVEATSDYVVFETRGTC